MKNRKKQAEFNHNLVGTPLSELARSLSDLADTIQRISRPYRSRKHVGRYNDCTVYEVKETTVRSHKRRGFVAVRVLRQPRKK